MFQFGSRMLSATGTCLFVTGLLGDGLLGLLLLTRGEWGLLGWHFLCAWLWAVGVNLLTRRGEQRGVTLLVPRNAWSLTALLVGTGTFPGFGVSAYSIACLVIKYGFSSLVRETPLLTESEILGPGAILADLPAPGGRVRSLVEDLQEGDTEARRAVVARIGHTETPEAMGLLRQLLSDTQAEIRSDASIALSRLDDELSRSLNTAFVAWQTNPGERERVLALGEQCYAYANSNVLDASCQRAYLALARDLLLPLAAQEEKPDCQWRLLLARVRQRLGEAPEALQDVRSVLQDQPEDASARLLAMELAFHTRSWDILLLLAHQEVALPISQVAEPTVQLCTQWWYSPDLKLPTGVRHG